MKKTILFVCMGNILRSTLAEELLNRKLKMAGLQKNFEAISRAVQGSNIIKPRQKPPAHKCIADYPKIWKIQKSLLKKLGVNLSNHFSQPLNTNDLFNSSLIVILDRQAHRLICDNYSSQIKNIVLMEIEDVGDIYKEKSHKKHNDAIIALIEKEFGNFIKI